MSFRVVPSFLLCQFVSVRVRDLIIRVGSCRAVFFVVVPVRVGSCQRPNCLCRFVSGLVFIRVGSCQSYIYSCRFVSESHLFVSVRFVPS